MIDDEPHIAIEPTIEVENELEPTIDEDESEETDPLEGNNRPGLEQYNLRTQRPRDYSHLHATLEDTVMTQFSMKQGIKEFGDAGVDAVLKELQQLHDRQVLEPRQPETMTREEMGSTPLPHVPEEEVMRKDQR